VRRDTPILAAAVVVAVVISLFTGSTAPRRTTKPVGTAPVVARTLVCPVVNGLPRHTVAVASVADVGAALPTPVDATGKVTATVLEGRKSKTTTLKLRPTAAVRSRDLKSQAVAITAEGSIAATLAADVVSETSTGRYRALAGGACLPPATDWWFSGGNGKLGFTDRLILANAAATDADVQVSLWTPKGPVSSPRLASVRVPARSRVSMGIYAVAPDIPTIAMHVHADSGAVTAAVFDRRSRGLSSNGGDLVAPTRPPARRLVVNGFPAGPGPRLLVVTNPGNSDVQVAVKVATPSGAFTPSSLKDVIVGAGQTKTADLTKAFNGLSGAVMLESDHRIIASGQASIVPGGGGDLRPDFVWLPATKPITTPVAVAVGRDPEGGDCLIILSAPEGAGSVRITTPSGSSRTINVAAGHSTEIDITNTVKAPSGSWPFVITSIGSAPVYAVRELRFRGAHGALVTSSPLTPLPLPIPLPAVRHDARLAAK
jgi:hypothetical protein